MPDIKTPEPALIEDVKRKWAENERFTVQEDSLKLLFHDLWPQHSNLAEMLAKVTVLDDFYSTNVYYKLALAKRIVELNPSQRIAAGDASLVNEMAATLVRGKQYRYYSFASKYCNRYNPDNFPIYDELVSKVLCHFGSRDGFAKFRATDLKDYPRYVEVIHAFKRFYGLEQFSLRWIDRYLWFTGREAFPRKQKAKRKTALARPA